MDVKMALKRCFIKRLIFYAALVLFAIIFVLYISEPLNMLTMTVSQTTDWNYVLNSIFYIRNCCMLNMDFETLGDIYVTGERNALLAYENEKVRTNYLSSWANKQGASIKRISSELIIERVKKVGRGYAFYLIASTEYEYAYENDAAATNMFRLGSYHSIDLIPGAADGTWVISREWYDDPLANYFSSKTIPADCTAYILSQSLNTRELSENRLKAVEYADTYCGTASGGLNYYKYNDKYKNFNSEGGDCTNFASQILYEGGFKKNTGWNYKNGDGTRAWLNAQGFKDYLLYSGRATQIARGKYKDVYKAAYKLMPGDVIAYVKKNKVAHMSVVTDLDSKGYPLVNSHNADRYRVPWDIGWNMSDISFYLLAVHY